MRLWSELRCLLILLGVALLVALPLPVRAEPVCIQIQIRGVINPAKVRYVRRALERAQAEPAEFLLVTLDTPGGLMSSMEEIAGLFTNARVPVVVFVWPRAAQATSAGALILLASDVAAMAPETRVGAAHPVGPEGKNLEGALDQKATNSMVALAKSLAARRGRPEKFAEQIVRQSASYTAQEAKQQGAIEIIAADRADLFAQLEGKKLELPKGKFVLRSRHATTVELRMSTAERMFDLLAEPTIASLLLSIGVLAILYELSSPGVGMAGVVGILSVLLGLAGLSVLPVRVAAVLLVVAGLVAVAVEAKVNTHGLVALGGVVGSVIGALLMVDEAAYFGALQRLRWQAYVPFLLLCVGLFLVVVRALRTTLSVAAQTGSESLVGKQGQATEGFCQHGAEYRGMVMVGGVRWKAVSEGPIDEGDQVVITQVLREPTRLAVRRQ